MAFGYTLLKTETLSGNKRRWYGYDVDTLGVILHMRLTVDVPGGPEVKVLDREIYIKGESVSSLSGLTFTELLEENLGQGMSRTARGATLSGTGVLVHNSTKIVTKANGVTYTIYPDENIYLVDEPTVEVVDDGGNIDIKPPPPPGP